MTIASSRNPNTVLICGGIILTVAMGIRHGFGLFLQPMSADLHWGRETFALALAVQNLVWGVTQPFAGMRPTGAVVTLVDAPCDSTLVKFSIRCEPGSIGIGDCSTSSAANEEATNVT